MVLVLACDEIEKTFEDKLSFLEKISEGDIVSIEGENYIVSMNTFGRKITGQPLFKCILLRNGHDADFYVDDITNLIWYPNAKVILGDPCT